MTETVLYTIQTTTTVTRNVNGRERRYEDISMRWQADRKETPIDIEIAISREDYRNKRAQEMLTAFLTREEALSVAEALREWSSMTEVTLNSHPLPFDKDLDDGKDAPWVGPNRTRGAGKGDLVMSYNIEGVPVLGWGRYSAAQSQKWAEGVRKVTLELPEGMANRIESKTDPAVYLNKLEVQAEAHEERHEKLPF